MNDNERFSLESIAQRSWLDAHGLVPWPAEERIRHNMPAYTRAMAG